jgi:phosphoribosylformylglycinamidine cyclo-ligase
MNKKGESAYKKAGVDISAATKAVDLMKTHIRSTFNESVVRDVGLFGGLIDVSFLKKLENPVLVWSIDGVGTKMMIAEKMNKFTVGQCIVNHCVNDILSQGANPIAFMDYVASAKLKPETMEKIVAEIAIACKAIGLPIIAGETAEMPGVYHEGRHDLVGATVGFVEKDDIIDGSKIEEGDMLIGLPSNGLHTNGFSLARKAFFESVPPALINTYFHELGCTVGEELLEVHKCYFQSVAPLLKNDVAEIHGIAHITGGGFFDNIGRLLKKGLCAEISYKWKIPPVFQIIQEREDVSDEEMRRVFNLGIGMVLIVPFEQTKITRIALRRYGEPNHLVIGTIRKSEKSDKGNVVFTF